ncbi:MAG: hypothetical protein KKC71_02770 [Chloroflexi bacterium]|nr:hypothetical protein [Chloroflexota bacterium]
MLAVEERVDRLEAIFGQFMTHTDMALTRMERNLAEFKTQAEKDRRELARQLGDIANRLGTVVEDIIAPSLRRMACNELGCGELQVFTVRIEKRHTVTGQRREFDALYVGDKAVLLNESKATVRPEYAAAFVEFLQSGEFFQYFPEYAGRPVVPVFSSLYIPEEIVTYLTKHGIYAVGMGDETMEVLNREEVAVAGASRSERNGTRTTSENTPQANFNSRAQTRRV